MAHNLTQRKDGTVEFASVVKKVQDRPWHGLGQEVDHVMTTKEAIIAAKLDWKVKKSPKMVQETGEIIPRDFAIIREDNKKYLGGVGAGYEIIQNEDVFNWFDSLLKEKTGAPIIETAGSLFGGKKIFVTAKLPGAIQVWNGVAKPVDEIEKYLFLTNTHDASGSIICGYTPIRIVCNNTLQLALKNVENVVRIKHTRKVAERLAIAGKIMQMVDESTAEMHELFNQMAKFKISDDVLKEFIAYTMSSQDKWISKKDFEECYSQTNLNLTEKIYEYAMGSETQKGQATKGKLYGAYNAITGYFQNVKEYDSQEEKFDELIIASRSTPQKRMIRAFDTAQAILTGKLQFN